MRRLLCFLLLLLTLTTQAFALTQEDLLPADKAFKFSSEVVGADKIKATWEIADGYYLYRKRFGFETSTNGLKVSDPVFPTGETKDDPNFGKIEVYHKQVVVEIPIQRDQTAAQAVDMALKVKYQGCADAGLCYPPQTQNLNLKLADATPASPLPTEKAAVSPTTEPAKPDILSEIKDAAGNNKAEALPVDQAFKLNVTALDKGTLNAHWTIQPDHHLYRPKIKFAILDPQGLQIGPPVFPNGETVDDEFFGKIEIYGEDIDVKVPFKADNLNKIVVQTEYQGCAENSGLCYPPVIKTTELSLAGLPAANPELQATIQNEAIDAAEPANEGDAVFNRMRDDSYFKTLLFFFLAGLGLAFTPCVFPMIPILSGIIAGYGNLSSRKAFWLSMAYVLPMALTYAIVGVIAGLSGANLQVMFQNTWVISAFAGLFVLLALSMFGFYDLQMPVSIQSRLSEISNRQQGGSFIGAGIMGILSALIVGPCVTAPLIGALVYIAQTRDALLGGLSLFTLGLGMGVPLLMIGTSAGRLLPRAGAWMDTTKAIFGIMMLGLAIWMLDRVVPLELTMALTGTLLVVSGIYMGALEKINEEAGGWGRFWKSIGLILLFYGAMVLFGVSAGSQNLLQPLKGVFGGSSAAATLEKKELTFQTIKGIEGLEQALAAAKTQNRPVMLDFYADWCVSCKELEATTFKDEKVRDALNGVMVLQADVTANDAQDKALNARFKLFGPPQILFFNPQGQELKSVRLTGYEAPQAFLERINHFKELLSP